ncbi:MAG: GntR family transcriptional regulator [Eubacterium sp.]|nr:GntR family transcriptional regulator [Eubacterium sp.]
MIPKYQRIADRLRAQLTGENRIRTTKLPTEKELCALYGVSRQTVRQALHVLESEGLIERRQGSGAYATGLHPDASHNRIAVLLPTDNDYTYARLRSDLQAPLIKEGFAVSFYLTGYSVAKERAILQQLQSVPLRGLIADPVKSALPNPNLDLYEKLWAGQLPTVFLHAVYGNFPPRTVIAEDDFSGAAQLTQYLIDKKHTRIAGIFRHDTHAGSERYIGFTSACAAADILWDDNCIRWYSSAELLALQKKQATGFLADFIRQNLGACSAVICQDDEIAYWLVKELTRAGKNVPEDVSVVSFDNSFLCEFSEPGLTSLAHKTSSELAVTAADALLAQMRGGTAPSVSLPFEIVERGSCASLG